MRYFIGLDFPPQSKLAIEQWRNTSWSAQPDGKPVPAANFHMTLAFIGQLQEAKLEALCSRLDEIVCPRFELQINTFNWWKKPPIAWLGLAEPPTLLLDLQSAVATAVKQTGIPLQHQTYTPHVTLDRHCHLPVPAPLYLPDIQIAMVDFCLFNSISGKTGVRYRVEHRWPLT